MTVLNGAAELRNKRAVHCCDQEKNDLQMHVSANDALLARA